MTLSKHFPNTNATKKVPIEGTPCVHQQNLVAYLHNYDMIIMPARTDEAPAPFPKVECHCYKCDNTVVMLLSGQNIVAMHG